MEDKNKDFFSFSRLGEGNSPLSGDICVQILSCPHTLHPSGPATEAAVAQS